MINPVTISSCSDYLISGLVVVEVIFAYPGFGRMVLEERPDQNFIAAALEVGALIHRGVRGGDDRRSSRTHLHDHSTRLDPHVSGTHGS